MPRTTLNAIQATRAGTTLPAAVAGDVVNGNSTANDGRVVLIVKNTNAASTARTLTVQTARTVDGLTSGTYRFATNGTGQTALPASITPGSNVATGFAGPWAAIGP